MKNTIDTPRHIPNAGRENTDDIGSHNKPVYFVFVIEEVDGPHHIVYHIEEQKFVWYYEGVPCPSGRFDINDWKSHKRDMKKLIDSVPNLSARML